MLEHLRASLDPTPSPVAAPGDQLAAVMLLLTDESDPRIVLTRRHEDLSRHPGEIAFPGGLPHPEDTSLVDTALRETEEEIGVARALIEVLGALDPVHTHVSGILIVPFVGLLGQYSSFTVNRTEISDVFDVPVSRLAEAEIETPFERDGQSFVGYRYDVDARIIWGATGRIVHDFLGRL
jgi:8-oxo-dGTP pyrophosphatase MutT (NUDIX family)